MARTASLNPKMTVQLRISSDLYAKVMAELYSPVEQTVPYGKWSEFVELCIREHYNPPPARDQLCPDCGSPYSSHTCHPEIQ